MKKEGRIFVFILLCLLGSTCANTYDDNINYCILQIQDIIKQARQDFSLLSQDALAVLLYTGKGLNSYGNFDSCERTPEFKYALATFML